MAASTRTRWCSRSATCSSPSATSTATTRPGIRRWRPTARRARSPSSAAATGWPPARATLEAVGLATAPYHANVPGFGEWGFVIAGRRPYRRPDRLPPDLKFLTRESLALLFEFPRDMARVPAEPNRLSNPLLVTTYEREWRKALP